MAPNFASNDLPTTYFAPQPGLWQLFFWGAFALISIFSTIGMLADPNPNLGGAIVGLGCLAVFVGYGALTWIERKRRRNPAVELSTEGIWFWRSSPREFFLPWDQLKRVWQSNGSEFEADIIFEPKDVKRYGTRTLIFFRCGYSVPVKTAAKDGTRLATIIGILWDRFAPQHAQSLSTPSI